MIGINPANFYGLFDYLNDAHHYYDDFIEPKLKKEFEDEELKEQYLQQIEKYENYLNYYEQQYKENIKRYEEEIKKYTQAYNENINNTKKIINDYKQKIKDLDVIIEAKKVKEERNNYKILNQENIIQEIKNKCINLNYFEDFEYLYNELSNNKNLKMEIIKNNGEYKLLVEGGGIDDETIISIKLLKRMFDKIVKNYLK